jgi:N-acetylglucosamine-6-phosphate deacetylase
LEGPFIAKEKKGAQKEDHIIPANKEMLNDLQDKADGLIKLVTIAPETEGAMECIQDLKDEFHFSIGHTMADYETACKAFEAGADHVTHLYNAMKPSNHREPSVAEAAADDSDVFVELICDGIHLHPSVVRNAFRIYGDDRVVLISDSMRATGMTDGEYTLGGQEVAVKGALATLADGTIAGSVTNLYECMKKAISMGIPKEVAIKAATVNPARSIGVDKEVGSIEVGKKADILVVNEELVLEKVILGGKVLGI